MAMSNTERFSFWVTGLMPVAEAYYDQPHRHYHTWQHVVAILESARQKSIDLTPAQFIAAIFHDAVYNPTSNMNEQLSANLMELSMRQKFRQSNDENWLLKNVDVFESLIAQARKIILATDMNAGPIDINDQQVTEFLDLDRGYLGADFDTFSHCRQLIRKEYPNITDEQFDQGERQFLESLLAQPFVFYHSIKMNQQMRDNIERWLSKPINR